MTLGGSVKFALFSELHVTGAGGYNSGGSHAISSEKQDRSAHLFIPVDSTSGLCEPLDSGTLHCAYSSASSFIFLLHLRQRRLESIFVALCNVSGGILELAKGKLMSLPTE